MPVGAGTQTLRAVAREVGRAIAPVGRKGLHQLATFPGSAEPMPVVAEPLADVTIERGRLRRPARFSRLRLELDPGAVEVTNLRA